MTSDPSSNVASIIFWAVVGLAIFAYIGTVLWGIFQDMKGPLWLRLLKSFGAYVGVIILAGVASSLCWAVFGWC